MKLGLLSIFVWLKVTSLWGHAPVYTGDGRVWAAIGSEPFTSPLFWFARRPVVLPLLFKLVGFYDPAILMVQIALSTLAWAALASSLSRLVPRGVVSLACFALVLMIALTTPVHSWDVVIRSESTAMSFVVLCIALSLRLVSRARARPRHSSSLAALAAFSGLLAAFSRDPSTYLVLLLAVWVIAGGFVLYGSALWQRLRHSGLRVMLALALSLGCASALAQANCRMAVRYDFPLMNVIFRRVLIDPEKLTYFAEKLGMPVSAPLLTMRGKFASSGRRFAFTAPALEDFRVWIHVRGFAGYQRYLLAHPLETAREAFSLLSLVTGPRSLRIEPRAPRSSPPALDAWLVAGPLSTRMGAAAVSALLLGAAGLFAKRRRTRLLGSVALFFALAGLSQLYVCYHADAMEVERHTIVVGTLLRLALGTSLCVAFALGQAAYRRVSAVRQREA